MCKKRLLWIFCLSFLWTVSMAQHTDGEFRAQTEHAFLDYYQKIGLQEKLYLITDKPYYSAGEKIYFSAFLLHPMRFTPATESKFLYVELISADGRLITRLKVLGNEGRFANAMPLSTKLDPGRYTLRAYTKWMSNFDEAFLFHKEIEVGNYIDDAIQTLVNYRTLDDKSVLARITLMNHARKRLANQEIEYTLNLRGKSKIYRSKSDENGVVAIKFRPSNAPDDCLRLKVSANDRILERTIQLPSFSDDFSVQFFPEGGNLIAGIPQSVAFKAIGVDGKAIEVEGVVCDSKQDTLCDLRSLHKGMGLVLLTAEPEEQYTATITSEKGLTRTFNLPKALSSGCTVQVKRSAELLLMKVSTTPDYPVSRLAAVIQSRGIIEAVIEDLSRLKRISTTRMKSGISLISIVDKESRQIVAERLVFIDNNEFATADISANKTSFSPREQLKLNFRIRNSRGLPASGRFAVSVTDTEAVELDPTRENIFSYLLLSSDLRGTIEKPAEYFNKEDENRREFLDLVMLTNGWRRYDVSKILTGSYPKVQYEIEKTQYVKGRVTGLFGKAKESSIAIFQKGGEMLGHFPLSPSARFKISGIDMPDTSYYFIQALNRKGSSRSVVIHIDPETFPSTNIPLPRPHFQAYKPAVTEAMLMDAKEKYYTEGGMRVIDIDAVVVTAKRESTYSYSSIVDGFNSLTDELSHYASVYDALQRFRELEVFGNEVRVRKNSPTRIQMADEGEEEELSTGEELFDEEDRTPNVLINGSPADISELDTYAMEDITKLAYLDAQEAIGLSGLSPNGLIIMEVRANSRRINTTNQSIAEIFIGGYSKPVEFYAPRYDTPETSRKKDLRTTIAWEPDLRSDATGTASLSFWTADRPNDYQVVLEGITDEGELCRATYQLKAKEQ